MRENLDFGLKYLNMKRFNILEIVKTRRQLRYMKKHLIKKILCYSFGSYQFWICFGVLEDK
jgi:hypothetical protein